ncbi:MAG: hypothetical protein WCJ58_01215 [bacterium]
MALRLKNSLVNNLLSSTQNKTYTVFIVTLIVIIAMFTAAIVPAYLSITNQLVENKEKRAYISEMDKYLANLTVLSEQDVEYSDKINLLESLYPNLANDEFYISNLDLIATKYNCQLNSVSFDKSGKNLPVSNLSKYAVIKRIPINIELAGELGNLQLLISHLEQFPAVVKISKLSYSNKVSKEADQSKNENKSIYLLTVNAEYFYWTYQEIK